MIQFNLEQARNVATVILAAGALGAGIMAYARMTEKVDRLDETQKEVHEAFIRLPVIEYKVDRVREDVKEIKGFMNDLRKSKSLGN